MKYLKSIDDVEFEVEYSILMDNRGQNYCHIDSINYNNVDFSNIIDDRHIEEIEYELENYEAEQEWSAKEAEYDRLKEDGDL